MNETTLNSVETEKTYSQKKVILIIAVTILATYLLTPKIINNYHFHGLGALPK